MITKTDRDIIQAYFEDHSGLLGGHAERVMIPSDEKEVVSYLREASSRGTKVTISGAGTGVTGGRVPFGGDVLSLEAMNAVIDIRSDKSGVKYAIVQPGVSLQELKKCASIEKMQYAPDPTEQSSWIGGNVSTNASGSRGLKYGSTRRYVRRLKMVMANGDRCEVRRGEIGADSDGYLTVPFESGARKIKIPQYVVPRIKNAAGYFTQAKMDLIDLFIGSEGTLGVATEIELELLPQIEGTLGGVAFFPSKELAWGFVEEARQLSLQSRGATAVDPLSLEYFDKNALELLRGDYSQIPLFADAAIYFEQDISNAVEDKIMDSWSSLLEKYRAPLDKVWFGTNSRDQESFREFRYRLPEKVNEIVKRNGLPKVGTDVAVPNAHFRGMMELYYRLFNESGLDYLVFGHIGENHMHANLLPANEKDYVRARSLYGELAVQAVRFGGTVSAEHGIGKLKHHFLEIMVGQHGLREMARVKKAFDPKGILCRGNVFPEDMLA